MMRIWVIYLLAIWASACAETPESVANEICKCNELFKEARKVGKTASDVPCTLEIFETYPWLKDKTKYAPVREALKKNCPGLLDKN